MSTVCCRPTSGWSRALLLPFTGDELELETCSV
jgi:hypothetical protein